MNYENMGYIELLSTALHENPNVIDNLIKEFDSVPYAIINSTEDELKKVKGIGDKKAKAIKALAELTRRMYNSKYQDCEFKVKCPKDAADIFMADLRFLKQEYLNVALLNTKNVVMKVVNISKGSLNASIVHPREIFAPAVKYSAAYIIVAHNHPSGSPLESSEDINITHRLKECGKILGIELLDHIIIGDGTYISLKEKGLI